MRNHTIVKNKTRIHENDPRWQSIINRDNSADGMFYYSVKTTGVYCRPSCAARLARPENVRFHMTCAEAEQAGFRPCKRCKPNLWTAGTTELAKRVGKICSFIKQSDEMPSLDDLPKPARLSANRSNRTFKSMTGLSSEKYANRHCCNRVPAAIEPSDTVFDAIHEAGLMSFDRFYDISNEVLDITPSTFHVGRADISFAIGECSLGTILVAHSRKGVCSIVLGDDPVTLACDFQSRFPQASFIRNDPDYAGLVAKIIALIENPAIGVDLPLDIRGTAFQRRVWEVLAQIPVGSTVSYSDIATRIGMPKAARAVARACGANQLAVAIPCHRVVKHDGSLSGYRWGVERKRALLKREAHLCRERRKR